MFRAFAIVFALFFQLANAHAQFAERSLTGRVVGVSDGDTITILSDQNQQHRIRFRDIDAPESNQAYGHAAKKSMSEMVFSKSIQAVCKGMHGDRNLCYVFLDGKDVGAEQVSRGYAWVEPRFAPKNSPLFQLESAARSHVYGLWRDPSPTPPWLWRKNPH